MSGEHKGRVLAAYFVGDGEYHCDYDRFLANARAGWPCAAILVYEAGPPWRERIARGFTAAETLPDGSTVRVTDHKGRTFDIVRVLPWEEYEAMCAANRAGR